MSLSFNRRQLLQSALGMGVSFALPGMSYGEANRRGAERPKSLILLWMAGGPSQLETWDPHPGTAIGGPTKAIETTLPGLQIGADYPLLAEQIDSLSVIRSLVSKEGDHERGTYQVKTGYRPDPTLVHPSLGAILTHELPDENVEIPLHISLSPGPWPSRGGFLGDRYDAFKVYAPGHGVHNLRPRVSDKRQERRLQNLEVVAKAFRQGREAQVDNSLHQLMTERALRMMSSEQLVAFEIDKEPVAIRNAYGDSDFGRGCLVARRLVEQGVRSIEVTLRGWDTHADNFEGHTNRAAELDPAFAQLIKDLRERDLLESTVVLCMGEFGRTPGINPFDGRDHWPSGFSCVVGGGGFRNGLLIGATDPAGEKKDPDDPIKINDFFATVLKVMNVDPGKELITPIGRPMAFSDGTPIERLMAYSVS